MVQSSWSGAQLNLEIEAPVTDIQGWLSKEAASKVFEASKIENKNFNELANESKFPKWFEDSEFKGALEGR